jgi:hypothetical protein
MGFFQYGVGTARPQGHRNGKARARFVPPHGARPFREPLREEAGELTQTSVDTGGPIPAHPAPCRQ